MRIRFGRSTLQSVLRRENMFTSFQKGKHVYKFQYIIKLEDIFEKKS